MTAGSSRATQSPRSAGSADSVRWQAVAVPSEHGGWSLTAEPALLGLFVAWSLPGLALGVAAMVAFVARTPLKLVLVDRFRQRWLPRTTLATQVAAIEILAIVGLVTYAVLAGSAFWPPLLVAAPLVALELWFDMRSRSRRLIPELAGSIGIGAIATAIALADGVSADIAWGLWLVVAARSVAAVPYVRTQVLRLRSNPGSNRHSDLAQAAAVVVAMIGWAAGLVPVAAVIVIAILAVANVGALRLAPRPAVVIGIQQTVVGVAVIAATALAVAQ